MLLYFAPLEGITGYIYRKAYDDYYGGISRYYSPFLVTRDRGIMKNKELKDILPENNEGINLVPQLLTNQSENFLQAAKQLQELGYREINLNLGCPSGTVVSRGRGAGFLDKTVQLHKFLDEIFTKCECDISIKTRIGMYDTDEFAGLLKIYNEYPVKELTIHPRTRQELYKGSPHREIFSYAYENSKNPLCYNGDINTIEQVQQLEKEYPKLGAVMIGRGLIARPGFVECTDSSISEMSERSKKHFKEFLDCVLEDYREVMSGDVHALHKMKEIWLYMAPYFTNYEKYLKKIKKTDKLMEYKAAVSSLFSNEEFIVEKKMR